MHKWQKHSINISVLYLGEKSDGVFSDDNDGDETLSIPTVTMGDVKQQQLKFFYEIGPLYPRWVP